MLIMANIYILLSFYYILLSFYKLQMLVTFFINSNQPTSVAPRSGATRGLVALRLERDSVLFYSRPIFKYE